MRFNLLRPRSFVPGLGLAVVFLLLSAGPAAAPFMGTIRHSVPLTIDIVPGSNNGGPTAVTVASISRRDRLKEVDTETIPFGQSLSVTYTLGANVVRLEVFIYPPRNGAAQFRLTQSGMPDITLDGLKDTAVVLDVTP